MTQSTTKPKSSKMGLIVAIVGIVLIIIGGAVALIAKSNGVRYSASLSNPLVVGPGVLGVIILIVGIAMSMRKAPPPATTETPSKTQQ